MGRIKKTATERHTSTLSPDIETFVKEAAETPLQSLPRKLDEFPQSWPFPRGDLYHWIPLLDRFDHVLELFNKEYALDQGPQSQPFECRLLQKGDAEEGMPYSAGGAQEQEIESLGYSREGDRELIESIVHFTRILLEHCGNRSLYASSMHLNNLLHTTSLSLLRLCLKLALRLAQRYHVARSKNGYAHAGALLLANHYAFNLDNLQKTALPFPRPSGTAMNVSSLGATPGKGKEKAGQTQTYNPSDLVTIAKEPQTLSAKGDLGSVSVNFYDQAAPSSKSVALQPPSEATPVTPTPTRRTSNLGPSRDRPSTSDSAMGTVDATPTPSKVRDLESATSTALQTYSISSTKLANTPAWALLKEALPQIPSEHHYDLLNRIRIAKVLVAPEDCSQQLVEVRLLSIANLAYALGESKFHEKIGIPDSEEPRRYHLAQQLCDLLQPATSNQKSLSLETEATVLLALEALAKSRHKSIEVTDALAITVNHGVLYYELRRVIASLHMEEHADKTRELQETEWRETTFELVNSLQQSNSQARYGERMVAAGIMGILIEALSLKTKRAERFHEKILNFFSSFVHNIPTAFQTLANLKGLDVLADLTQHQVDSALQAVESGNGLPQRYKSKVVDYSIPFYQQSTLRQLFKFTVHMYEHNAGTHDRLLRNFIDTPQILSALKKVIEHAAIFGSNVWSGAVNIMSSFIHNEPTSYQVVGEAGLTKSLLESITQQPLPDTAADADDYVLTEADLPADVPFPEGEPRFPLVPGILPVSETMQDIPSAFGAICLNDSGMKLFQASKVLTKFFDIFVSPAHVKVLEDEGNSAESIGHAFDELSRHHPPLKTQIMMVVVAMVARVAALSNDIASYESVGAKLWLKSPTEDIRYVAGGVAAMTSPSADYCNQVRSEGGDFRPHPDTAELRAEDVKDGVSERAAALPYISACIKFLHGFFHNSSMTAYFCEMGGTEHVLDLVTSPSHPYDISAFQVHNKFSKVLKTMCDAKPHLVLPSIIRRTQNALMSVKPVLDSSNPGGVWAKYIDIPSGETKQDQFPIGLNGTTVLKELAKSSTLISVLGTVFAPPQYTSRHSSQTNQLFTTLNFTDVYIQLVDDLSSLHAACSWENLALLNNVSPEFKDKTDPKAYMMRRIDANGCVVLAAESRTAEESAEGRIANGTTKAADLTDEQYAIKNAKAIRFVLNHVPQSIETFFHSIGQGLFPKRNADTAQRQHAMTVADHLAQNMLWELDYRKYGHVDEATELRYVTHTLHAFNKAMLKSSFSMDGFGPKEALTLVLNKFYLHGGFEKLNGYLARFGQVLSEQPSKDDGRTEAARNGLRWVLDLYGHVVRAKTITDAYQSQLIANRERESADYFMPGQFVVEIRNAVLPAISALWSSPAIEKVGDQYVKQMIQILQVILKSEGEDRAIKRSDNATRRAHTHKLKFKLTNEMGLSVLTDSGVETRLAREAIYRCNNHQAQAQEYARLRPRYPSFPIPDEPTPVPTQGAAEDISESSASLQRQRSVEMTDAQDGESAQSAADTEEPSVETPLPPPDSDLMSDDDAGARMVGRLRADIGDQDLMAMVGSGRLQNMLNLTNGSSGPSARGSTDTSSVDTKQPFVTVDDLDEKRQELRDSLIDRCLEVLSAVPGTTFELADLIQAAVAKTGEGANPRADIGRTLVSSLLSLQMQEDEPSAESGVKISAYAHLVALILQDRDFFDSTLDELKAYFDNLVTWVDLELDQKAEDAPWMEMVLLIIERVLAEDEQPPQITWNPPPPDDPLKVLPEVEVEEPAVPEDVRSRLFDAMVGVLPKVGKNSSLALSVLRVLVTLTRRRELALRLSQKQSMSRLFVMMRQLPPTVDDKLRTSFMLILRHMIEDEQMVRQIMQTEIRAAFEGHRSSRAMDTTTYTRNLYHLVLRDPDLFVDVTKETLEVARYDGRPTNAQTLALKKEKPAAPADPNDAGIEPQAAPQPSVETGSTEVQKSTEVKPPVVESADGVMTFLLRELSNYKEVEDTVPVPSKESQAPVTDTSATVSRDIDMADETPPAPNTNGMATAPPSSANANKTEKTPFKPEEHSIYIYRCFILQCLAELLASYNRTKVEFINFSRKPETQPATPAKPRAGTLNYLLNVLIPIGTLEHKDDMTHRKKASTSSWATTVLVSLCAKTTEKSIKGSRRDETAEEEDPDLTFVRRFVLEHAVRSFREATVSTEPLDLRYSRLLGLGELFNRMLNNKVDRPGNQQYTSGLSPQIGRLMYEKHFIGALTAAIAELDLNFPNAKRAVKYILGPLRQLTDLGVTLSETSDSSVGAVGASTEEDEISSATSVSGDEDDDREQTPDLLRNTTLGMLESGGADDDDDGSGSEDEEDEDMYDQGYDEEMEYDEEVAEHGDVVSDEDEEIEGMGDVEGLHGDPGMDVEIVMADGEEDMEDDDDDDDDDEEDDDDDDDDDDGEQEFADHMEEITGDDDNGSLAGDEEGDWEEDDGLDFDDQGEDSGSPHGGPLDHMARVIAGDEHSDGGEQDGIMRVDMGDGEDDFFEDEMAPEDGDDEDEEVDYENDVVYEPELENEDGEDLEEGFGWDAPAPPAMMRGHHHPHHHHHPRGFNEMFGMLGGGDTFRPPAFRSHRTASAGRGEDDGTNPLLQREGARNDSRDRDGAAAPSFGRLTRRTWGLPPQADGFIQDLMAAVGPAAGQGPINVSIGGLDRFGGGIPHVFQLQGRPGGPTIDFDPNRPWRDQLFSRFANDSVFGGRQNDGRANAGSDEAQAVEFHLTPTIVRWQEEARMLFGGKHHEKATRIINSLLRVLVPPAMEAKNQQDKAEKKAREEREKAREEERNKAEAERLERETREKQEREEREAREREEAARREQEARDEAGAESAGMEGVEQTQSGESVEAESSGPPQSQEPTERITTTIRGRQVDITELGIDPAFLEELPEEFREEAVMSMYQDRRAQAVQAGEAPGEISRDFLDALPRELQQELLRSEASARRQHEREEARRLAQQGGAAQRAQPEDLTNADFMAMLEPALRQQILIDQDENTLLALPEDLQAEARALIGDRPLRAGGLGAIRHARDVMGSGVRIVNGAGERPEAVARETSRQRRPVIQMLDKAGVATLLRLMFVSLHHKAKANLHSVLSDVCKNIQNRADVISNLLTILQDGTADMAAVEKSFVQLSSRAKQAVGQKTPQPLKRTPTGLSAAPMTDLSPLNIVQQCLSTLSALSADNQKVPTFFLTEHEIGTFGPKIKALKKGKGKESKAAKYPLNALLTLLDRKLITENTSVMETLASLLSRVTHPLTVLLRRAKESQNAEQSTTERSEQEPVSASDADVAMLEASTADVSAQTAAQTESGEPKQDQGASKEGSKSDDKKHRMPTPPEVPEENIRLVVNILAARECPSKTFSDTLDIIKNLSAIPGAKEVFGKELVRQAQELGQTVLADLQELAKQIDAAETSTDLQGLALANFSSAGSKQRKLLRVLLALDHLFDPKRSPASSTPIDPKLKDDVLSLLYESETFESLWTSLTSCLAAIRRRGNMVNVATILLPLIESLMVVCRNSSVKEDVVSTPVDTTVTSPPPADSRMESLFFRFTEDNRKILNELIRNNPKLMSGNLSILAKNSKVLEFDNKRTYFTRKLHNRGEVRVSHPSLQLGVRRDQVFLDSYRAMYFKSGDEIKYGKLNIRFNGEEGIDAGGVSREWFAAMARQMFNPDYALFNPVNSDRTTFHPNPLSEINHEHLSFFKFIGRIIGKALYEGRVLDCHFSRAVYRRILGKTVTLKDMESLDLEYYKSLDWILHNDITDVTFETFSIERDRFGVTDTIDLLENGRNIPVTEDNKQQYVQLVVEHRLIKSVEHQLEQFLLGFHEIIPKELVSIFNEQELELLISGLPDIDVDDWKNNAEYHNYQSTSPQIQWFWRAVRSFDKEEKAKLLQFITGTSKVPLNGFGELEGMNGFAKFNIHRDYSSKEKLPSSHTCFNQLDLPEYESYEHLRQQLYTAITQGGEYFGFA